MARQKEFRNSAKNCSREDCVHFGRFVPTSFRGVAAYLGRFVPRNRENGWGLLAYPHDPARAAISWAEQGSPWSLDHNTKVLFASLPHNSVDAVQKVKGLFAKIQGTEPRWRAQA